MHHIYLFFIYLFFIFYFLFRVSKKIILIKFQFQLNFKFSWFYKKIAIPECILLSTLRLLVITLCLEGGVRSTDEFSALLLQSFWHCSFTSFKNKHLTAFLKGRHCMIISAIWWVVHPVNISVANVSTVLVPSSKSGSSLSWYKFKKARKKNILKLISLFILLFI